MSRLLQLRDQMVAASMNSLMTDDASYIAMKTSLRSEAGTNAYTSANKYQDSFDGNGTSDRLLVLGAKSRTEDNPNPPYNNTHPYEKVPNEKSLRFTSITAPQSVVPPEGRPYSTEFHGGNQYNDRQPFAPIAAKAQGIGVTDSFAIANWARNIAQEFGIIPRPGDDKQARLQNVAKGVQFLATQVLLTSMNPTDPLYGGPLNAIYNPLSLALSAVPFTRVATTLGSPTIAAAASVDGNVYSQNAALVGTAADRHVLMRQGSYLKGINGTDVNQLNFPTVGFYGDLAKTGGKQDTLQSKNVPGIGGIPIEAQVDQAGPFGKVATVAPYQINTYTPDSPYKRDGSNSLLSQQSLEQQMLEKNIRAGNDIALAALFKDSPSASGLLRMALPLVGTVDKSQKYTWLAKAQDPATAAGFAPLNQTKSALPAIDADFAGEDENSVTHQLIADSDNYMPFYFQDLRSIRPTYLYFRAFLRDGLQESFAPGWNATHYYGRIDDVPTYQKTERSLSFSFDVVACAPQELAIIWRKLHKLQSMVYPSFDTDYFLQAGPLIRLRIGDLICAGPDGTSKKGLPGYISSLNFAYDDNIWNITEKFKVPRKINVSINYIVVHEGNPGIYYNGQQQVFGALEYRSNDAGVVQASGGPGQVGSYVPNANSLRGINADVLPDSPTAVLNDVLNLATSDVPQPSAPLTDEII